MRKGFYLFSTNAKSVSFLLTKCEECFNFSTKSEKCFKFFDKIREVFQFFGKMQKVFHLFPTKCKKCFNIFDKMRKVFQIFLQSSKNVYKMQKPLGYFLLVYNFSSVFPNMCAKINQIS